MSEDGTAREVPTTVEEVEAARLLAVELDDPAMGLADPQAMAVVRLLQAVAEPDDAAALRSIGLRAELVQAAARRRRWPVPALAAAAAVLVALLSVSTWRGSAGRTEQLLSAREDAARAGLTSLNRSGATVDPDESRGRSTFELQWQARLDSALESERFARLSEHSATSVVANSLRTNHNPGGTS